MPFAWSSLSASSVWLVLPLIAAVCVAVGSFLYLQSAVERRSTVNEAEKAEWKQKLLDEGKKVIEAAKQKAASDAAAIKANIQEKLNGHTTNSNSSSSSSQPSAANEKPTSANDGRKQRKGAAAASVAQGSKQQLASPADDSGMASGDDWELVDDESIERVEESQYEPPIEYQRGVETFIEALHETPNTAVDELHAAVKAFYNVLCGVLDGSSNVTPLPSTRSSTTTDTVAQPPSALSPTDRYATRNVILSYLVDTQSMHAIHQLVETHPGTPLAADAQHLHELLVPLLHSH